VSSTVPAGAEPRERPASSGSWHALDAGAVLERLDSRPGGLGPEEASARLSRHGPNTLAPPKPVPAWRVLLDQFASLVVALLLVAALVAALVGDRLEAGAIAVVLAINTVVGFTVELRARRAMEGLLRFQAPTARVVRASVVTQISAAGLVPGDVIELESGDAVPADARLLEGAELHADEAALTGESMPVAKATHAVAERAPIADRTCMLHAGTTITGGRGRAVVVATGRDTELGRVGALLEQIREGPTPLERRLAALGKRLIGLTLGVTGMVVVVGVLNGSALRTMIETGVALAIAAIPEGLPAVATIALAVGMHRMARRRALVRELDAVEALGAATVVCADKTGTLTANEMTVTRVVGVDFEAEVSGVGFFGEGRLHRGGAPVDLSAEPHLERLLEAAALTSRATVDPTHRRVTGDRTDAALLVLARKGGQDARTLQARLPRESEIPFSSVTCLSASVHRDGSEVRCLVKGAPSAVLERCDRVAGAVGTASLDRTVKEALEVANAGLAAAGRRVIALAEGDVRPKHPQEIRALVFLGFAAIIDPPAVGVRETIEELHDAGILTVMITGDQAPTARSIALDVGLMNEHDLLIDGPELTSMEDERLAEALPRVRVYSRVSPEQKVRIVASLQDRGETVAMLGDGVNDAAALKQSDVGVVMGLRGTDVAKETAAVVLEDDRFATIAVAVEEGRIIHDNIRKFVFYLFSCNLAEVLVLMVSALAALPLPLLPLQILWLNLVTDTFPALALALEPGEAEVMQRPPRNPEAPILSGSLLRALLFYAGLITAVTLLGYGVTLRSDHPEAAVTVSFMTLALAQLFHLGNARSRRPVLGPRQIVSNPWALAAVPLVVGLQLLSIRWTPLAAVLGTVALETGDLLLVFGLAVIPGIVGQSVDWAQTRAVGRTAGAP